MAIEVGGGKTCAGERERERERAFGEGSGMGEGGIEVGGLGNLYCSENFKMI